MSYHVRYSFVYYGFVKIRPKYSLHIPQYMSLDSPGAATSIWSRVNRLHWALGYRCTMSYFRVQRVALSAQQHPVGQDHVAQLWAEGRRFDSHSNIKSQHHSTSV